MSSLRDQPSGPKEWSLLKALEKKKTNKQNKQTAGLRRDFVGVDKKMDWHNKIKLKEIYIS